MLPFTMAGGISKEACKRLCSQHQHACLIRGSVQCRLPRRAGGTKGPLTDEFMKIKYLYLEGSTCSR